MRFGHDTVSDLARVRRFEAAGFRAWPASTVHYDGTWLLRLTAGLPAKRLNSVNPLDPSDHVNLEDRIARAARRFDAYGWPVTFRISPLAGERLSLYLDEGGWSRFDESVVLRRPLDTLPLDGVIDQIPLKDMSRFISAAIKVHEYDDSRRPGLSEVIGSIEPDVGLFVAEGDGGAAATAICVHDGDLAGLFEIATHPRWRGMGHGRRIVLAALKWARLRGATEAWLQVEADNAPALALYGALGFAEAYRYHYRRPPDGA